MALRRYVVAVDRSSRSGLEVEVFSVVVVDIGEQNHLIRYSDFFKHMRKLGLQKRIYVPKMLKLISELIDRHIIVGLRVFTRLDSVVEIVHSRGAAILACVVDDNIYRYHTSNSRRASDYLKNIQLVLLESTLKKPGRELIEKTHRVGLKMVTLRTIMKISDNIANYTRNILEDQLKKIPQIWKL